MYTITIPYTKKYTDKTTKHHRFSTKINETTHTTESSRHTSILGRNDELEPTIIARALSRELEHITEKLSKNTKETWYDGTIQEITTLELTIHEKRVHVEDIGNTKYR